MTLQWCKVASGQMARFDSAGLLAPAAGLASIHHMHQRGCVRKLLRLSCILVIYPARPARLLLHLLVLLHYLSLLQSTAVLRAYSAFSSSPSQTQTMVNLAAGANVISFDVQVRYSAGVLLLCCCCAVQWCAVSHSCTQRCLRVLELACASSPCTQHLPDCSLAPSCRRSAAPRVRVSTRG